MDGLDGLELFTALQSDHPGIPVILITAHGSINEAVAATQEGVFAFLTKPIDKDRLHDNITRAMSQHAKAHTEEWAEDMVYGSAAMIQLMDQARRIAATSMNVMILGESGTGKEVLAKAVHRASRRSESPFVAINCSAIPGDLLESELFGHSKGAFSGAIRDHDGLFARADGGTVFLDEIGDMPVALQAKLLRVLQEGSMRPVGSSRDRDIDVRILSATHRSPADSIRDGTFREDLYYRLNGIELTLPPLRHRQSDIPLLARHFLKLTTQRHGAGDKQLSSAALGRLMNYSWPGNIRQLANILEQLVVLCPGKVIGETQVKNCLPEVETPDQMPSLADARRRFDREYLQQVLVATKGNMTLAAKLAGRNRSDFHKLVKRHGLAPEEMRENKRDVR